MAPSQGPAPHSRAISAPFRRTCARRSGSADVVPSDTLGTIINTATVSSVDTRSSELATRPASATTVPSPRRPVDHQVGAELGGRRGDSDLELSVVNRGPSTARNVVVADPLPAGTTLTRLVAVALHAASTAVTCDLGDLAPSTTPVVRSFTVTASSTFVLDGSVVNAASVRSDTADPDPGNNSSMSRRRSTPAPTCRSEGGARRAVRAGAASGMADHRQQSNGPSTAQSVRIEDVMPQGFAPTGYTSSAARPTARSGRR